MRAAESKHNGDDLKNRLSQRSPWPLGQGRSPGDAMKHLRFHGYPTAFQKGMRASKMPLDL